MNHQIIFLNGPRRSGKDQAGRFIANEYLASRHRKFAGPMKECLRRFFNIGDTLWEGLEGKGSTALKLQPLPELFGRSWVETLIWFSEEVMKPTYGNDLFGQLMVEDLQKTTAASLTYITDCGFREEVLPVVAAYGAENCHMFQLFRPDCSFAGDSRGYLQMSDFPKLGSWQMIQNCHEKLMYRIQILSRVNKIMGIGKSYE